MYVTHQLSAAGGRRGWSVSLLVHAALLLLCFLPFLLPPVEKHDLATPVIIDFSTSEFVKQKEEEVLQQPTEFTEEGASMASGRESAQRSEGAGSGQDPGEIQPIRREQVNVTTVSPAQPTTSMTAPTRSIVTSDAEPDVVMPSTKPSTSKSDRFFDQPINVNDNYEIDRVEAFKTKPNPSKQQSVTWHVADAGSEDAGAPTSFDFGTGKGTGDGNKPGQGSGTGTGPGSGPGNSKGTGAAPDGQGEDGGYDPFGKGDFPDGKGKGTGSKGSNTGVGQDGKGLKWGDFAGDGLFSRKVIKRADAELARIATQPGNMVINLCVDQLGKVTFTQYDILNSTIKDKTIAAKAEQVAKLYVFAEDPSSPREQCGRLNFVFRIEN